LKNERDTAKVQNITLPCIKIIPETAKLGDETEKNHFSFVPLRLKIITK